MTKIQAHAEEPQTTSPIVDGRDSPRSALNEGDQQMSVEAVSPITTYFRVCDGVRVRFADTKADSDTTLLLLV